MPTGKYTRKNNAMEPVRCSFCGEEFQTDKNTRYRFRHGERVYHSAECRKNGKIKPQPKRTLLERFMSHCKRLPDECLECDLKPRNRDGYPSMVVDGRHESISHVAWFLHYGYWPPKDKVLDHRCHDPAVCKLGRLCPHRRCAEWSHLDAVTATTVNNSHERSNAGWNTAVENLAKTACKRGHPFTEENTYRDKKGDRYCRTCHREYERRVRAAKRDAAGKQNTYSS